jgi:hypothetical protein
MTAFGWNLVACEAIDSVSSSPFKGRTAALLTLAFFLITTPTWATTLHVENWGVDSGSCGAAAAPCRSIGKATSLAAAGDTVLVGPGRYSNDLNGNSVYGELGEEPAAGILLLNSMTIKSTHGAAATRIEFGGNFSAFAVIQGGSSAVFGTRNHGFTVVFQQSALNVLRVLYIQGTGGKSAIAGNVVFVNSVGPGVDAITALNGTVASDNRVTGLTPTSIYDGIVSDTLAQRNVVAGSQYGIVGSGAMRNNVAIENGYGFRPQGAVTDVTKNIASSNGAYGIYLYPGATVSGAVQRNTIVGNDVGTNCGLYNDSGGALTATKNFWGAATGPGADPADLACSGVGSSTTTTPFLAAPAAPGPGALQ